MSISVDIFQPRHWLSIFELFVNFVLRYYLLCTMYTPDNNKV